MRSSSIAGVLTLTLFVAGGLAKVPQARADEDHFQTFPVGERALGMGGAFTGFADAPSAAWYNPAGLAHLERDALAGSLQLTVSTHRVVEDGYGSPVGTADLEHSGLPAIPLFVGVVKRLGRRDDTGLRRHAFALSTTFPNAQRYRFDVALANSSTGVRDALRIDREARSIWYGPSWAYRVSPTLAFGISGFLVTRRVRHSEDHTIITEGVLNPARGTFENATLSVRETMVKMQTRHIVFRLGAMWDATDRLRLGVMVQPPGIELTDTARIRERRAFADTLAADSYATLYESEQKNLSAAAPVPLEVRLGTSYAASESFVLALDVGLVVPRSGLVRAFGQPAPEPITGETPQPGDFFADSYRRDIVVNAALGFEAVAADVIPIRAGVYTDLSAAPSIDGPTDLYAHDDVDRVGSTFSIGYRSEDYDLSVGVAALFGFGTGLRTNPDPGLGATPEAYLPTDVRERTIFFFISGAQSTVSRLARHVYREHIRGPRRNRQEPEAGAGQVPQTEAGAEPEAGVGAEPEAQHRPDSVSELESESESELELELELELESELEPGAISAPVMEPGLESEVEAEPLSD